MVGPAEAYATSDDGSIFSNWIVVEAWLSAETDAEHFVSIATATGARWAVLDDYRVDATYQAVLRAANLRWLQFDGAAQKPLWADLILNANPATRPEDYAAVVHNPIAKLLLGPRYAILRPEFPPAGLRPLQRPVEQVLVTFGGGDDRGAIEFVLSTLLPCTPATLRFLVISGAYNPLNQQLAEWIDAKGNDRVTLCVNPEPVAPLFASCDLAIMAGGTTTYEAACCGLPMILVSVADNQVRQSMAWQAVGAAVYLGAFEGIYPELLKSEFFQLFKNDRKRNAFANVGAELVDGFGVQRIAKEMSV